VFARTLVTKPLGLALSLACAAVACSSDPATAIRVGPTALFFTSAKMHAVIRVSGSNGDLRFCKAYDVDESKPPGETLSLTQFDSTLVLTPGEAGGEASLGLRVTTELRAGGATGDECGGVSAELIARKVAIVRYAEGKSLPLRMRFEASCLGVQCIEASETCDAGLCVPATIDLSSGAVEGEACFAIEACPTLARATPLSEACTYALPTKASRGYVAALFTFGGTSATEAIRGATVLSETEIEPIVGDVVRLKGPTCELAKSGVITDLFYGYECDPPRPGARICPHDDPSAGASASLGKILTGGIGGVDASVPDGRVVDSAGPDALPDGVADATLDGFDGAGDAASEADARADGATDAGTDGSATDSGGEAGGALGRVACGQTFCIPPGLVCVDDPSTTLCFLASPPRQHSWTCDDQSDCASGAVCCRTAEESSSNLVFSSVCTPLTTCAAFNMQVSCSADDTTCPAGSTCVTSRNSEPGARVCVPDSDRIQCGMEQCAANSELCCFDNLPVCESRGAGTCFAALRCDDSSDCQANEVCCCQDCSTLPSGQCVGASMCGRNTDVVLCSPDDARCPSPASCISSGGALPPYFCGG